MVPALAILNPSYASHIKGAQQTQESGPLSAQPVSVHIIAILCLSATGLDMGGLLLQKTNLNKGKTAMTIVAKI